MRVPQYLVREEDFTSGVMRDAAKLVNFVWLLARVHRRPEALRFLTVLARSLAPFIRGSGVNPEYRHRA